MKLFARALAVPVLVLGLGLGASRPAAACYNETELKLDPRTIDVAAADQLLANDQPVAAAQRVLARFPNLRSVTVEPTFRDALLARSARILAVAIARTEGRTSFGESTAWAPSGNLAWAEVTLREVTVWKAYADAHRLPWTKSTEAPDLASDLAETLALQAQTRAEGKKLLESLDKRDLLGSAFGYRALARLRAEDGEADQSRVALARCKVRATRPSICARPVPPARG